MSYTINLQHIVFRTDRSEPTIPQDSRREMLAYINTMSKNLGVKVLRINAHLNHVHIFVDLNSKMSVSKYVQQKKGATSRAFTAHRDFPTFRGWARKYGSFSKSESDKEKIINYVKNQDEHHRVYSFQEELEQLFGKMFFQNPQTRHDWLDEPMLKMYPIGDE